MRVNKFCHLGAGYGVSFLFLVLVFAVSAEVHLPAVFGDHMVLQQGQRNPVWGWGKPGEKVSVKIAGQIHQAIAGEDGRWQVLLEPLPAVGPYQLEVAGENKLTFKDVVSGEVWVCSGQSNMQMALASCNDADLEIRTAQYPDIRLITVPQTGTQHAQRDFDGRWELCSPDTVANFSAVGYLFGRTLHQSLNVPIGLIDNSWGGSSAEAWVPRDILAADVNYGPLLERWQETEAKADLAGPMEDFEKQLAEWDQTVARARAQGQEIPRRPRAPGPGRNELAGQHRPGNLYQGVLKPILGYGIRGVIWYQGESNAGRAYQYRDLFSLMIDVWREHWGQGDFPFYWVQLADFMEEKPEPAESAWAELREAQTMTMSRLKHTGQAVIIDIGEGRDIHPRNKQGVANRLARWALAENYGMDIPYRSPIYKSMEIKDGKVLLTFDHAGSTLYSFDTKEPVGFAVAGEDRNFVWAQARIVGKNLVEVWSDSVKEPVAVRYAWADNPVCNLQSREGLPVTPFRTDDWPGVTMNNKR